MTALWINDPDFRLYVGDALTTLQRLPDGSVDCCVTSPPYWNLRDYGVDGQLGLEATPGEFVARMVEVFREVRRVLAAHGTCWINLGDSYNAYNGNRGDTGSTLEGRRQHLVGRPHVPAGSGLTAPGLKSKDMVGIPWRVAFALQDDGWWLRSDIIWSKPNPMPESVTDRPTKSHEYVFLLTKSARYYYDQEAVLEPYETTRAPGSRVAETDHYGTVGGNGNRGLSSHLGDVKDRLREARRPQTETLDGTAGEAPRGPDGRRQTRVEAREGSLQHRDGDRWPGEGRNMRTVWTIPTQSYPDAHFATFPEELARRCILAGCPERVCTTCGAPSSRVVDVEYTGHRGQPKDVSDLRAQGVATVNAGVRAERHTSTLGWTDCGHNTWRPGHVLDPFIGSGTTALVARHHHRHTTGIELNPTYAQLAADRTHQLSLMANSTPT